MAVAATGYSVVLGKADSVVVIQPMWVWAMQIVLADLFSR
jgi:hypothetical protein